MVKPRRQPQVSLREIVGLFGPNGAGKIDDVLHDGRLTTPLDSGRVEAWMLTSPTIR